MQVYWGVFPETNLQEGGESRTGQRETLTCNEVVAEASADPTVSCSWSGLSQLQMEAKGQTLMPT